MRQLNFLALIDTTPLLDDIITPSHPDAIKYLKELKNSRYHAFDVETTDYQGRNGLDYMGGQIRLLQVGLPESRKVLLYDLFKDNSPLFLRTIKGALESKTEATVGHNILFDMNFVRRQLGWVIKKPRDTMILSRIYTAGVKQYRHGMADVYKRLFDKEVSKEQQASDWGQPCLSNSQINYACNDVLYTLDMYFELCKRIREYNNMPDIMGGVPLYTLQEIAEIECNCIEAFNTMSITGIPVDVELGYQVIKKYEDAIADIYQPVLDSIGLPYTAQPVKIALAVYNHYDVKLFVDNKRVEEAEEGDDKEYVTQHALDKEKPEKKLIIPYNKKLSTTTDTLFEYYCQTNIEHLLRITLARSLKKSLDALKGLVKSAEQNQGWAHTEFSSLGSTGTGRSNSKGSKKSTLEALNIQNIATEIEHPLVQSYDLPQVRSIIRVKEEGHKLSIIDLSSSHFRYVTQLCEDEMILKVLNMKDPHCFNVSLLFQQQGKNEKDYDYCLKNKKKDREVIKYRKITKKVLYSIINVAGVHTILASLKKGFVKEDYESVKEVRKVFEDNYIKLFRWQRDVNKRANQNQILMPIVTKKKKYQVKYCQYKTPDGRLIHLPQYEREYKDKKTGKLRTQYKVKISDVTSSTIISPEAICMKKALIRCNNLLESTNEGINGDIKLINFCHDELVFYAKENAVHLIADCYNIIAEEFGYSLRGVDPGMYPNDGKWKSTLAISYDEK